MATHKLLLPVIGLSTLTLLLMSLVDGTQAGRNCKVSEFACADGKECIRAGWKCDGGDNCTDQSDEHPIICERVEK